MLSGAVVKLVIDGVYNLPRPPASSVERKSSSSSASLHCSLLPLSLPLIFYSTTSCRAGHIITPSLKMKTATLLALIPLVAGHGAIIKATTPAGGSGMALGIDTSTPRDGTRRDPFQQDATRFKGDAADTVGETLGGGNNDLEAGTKAIMAETGDMLPQVTPGGEIQMTIHQINGDGAGPYECMVNADGTAATWTNIQVTTNVPGQNGRNRVSKTLPNFIPLDISLTLYYHRTVPPPTSPSTPPSLPTRNAQAPWPANKTSAWSGARTPPTPGPSAAWSPSRWRRATRRRRLPAGRWPRPSGATASSCARWCAAPPSRKKRPPSACRSTTSRRSAPTARTSEQGGTRAGEGARGHKRVGEPNRMLLYMLMMTDDLVLLYQSATLPYLREA